MRRNALRASGLGVHHHGLVRVDRRQKLVLGGASWRRLLLPLEVLGSGENRGNRVLGGVERWHAPAAEPLRVIGRLAVQLDIICGQAVQHVVVEAVPARISTRLGLWLRALLLLVRKAAVAAAVRSIQVANAGHARARGCSGDLRLRCLLLVLLSRVARRPPVSLGRGPSGSCLGEGELWCRRAGKIGGRVGTWCCRDTADTLGGQR